MSPVGESDAAAVGVVDETALGGNVVNADPMRLMKTSEEQVAIFN